MGTFEVRIPVLILFIVISACSKDNSSSSDSNYPDYPKDSMSDCTDYQIDRDTFFHFIATDTQMVNYASGEEVKMVRNNQDTIVFRAGLKRYSTFSHILVPCRYYYAYYDNAELTFTNDDSLEFSVKWELLPQYQSNLMGSVYRNFGIWFDGLVFYNKATEPQKDGIYALESKSLKSYVIYVQNGKIVSMKLRGGESWETIP